MILKLDSVSKCALFHFCPIRFFSCENPKSEKADPSESDGVSLPGSFYLCRRKNPFQVLVWQPRDRWWRM